eukprot:1937661-Rhodomonas_salina.1
MPGTDAACGTKRRPVLTRCTELHACYGMPGTEKGYGGTSDDYKSFLDTGKTQADPDNSV